jgi:hypothetical protein
MPTYECSSCHHKLGENEAPCPNCGDTRRTVRHVSEIKMPVSVSLSITLQSTKEEIRKNWPLIVVLILGDLVSTTPAYFLSGWTSVAATLGFIVFSTIVGYYAITRVITTTIEKRK